MPEAMPAAKVLDREFLEMRAKILELAASFDRLQRGGGGIEQDLRFQRLIEALNVLQDSGDHRAEQVQMIFSRPYDEKWRQSMKV